MHTFFVCLFDHTLRDPFRNKSPTSCRVVTHQLNNTVSLFADHEVGQLVQTTCVHLFMFVLEMKVGQMSWWHSQWPPYFMLFFSSAV